VDGWLRRWLGRKQEPFPGLPPGYSWILVPLGNPGDEYASTRHNLGRLLLQRWMETHGKPELLHRFRTGSLYRLQEPFLALVPATYMNLSGQVCGEATQVGLDPKRFILLHDDKDLPLGLGRFRLEGSDGGHNGLRSVFEHLGTPAVARLRLGIGPFTRPLDQFVLGTWTEEEWSRIEVMDEPFERFMKSLASIEHLALLPSRVNAEPFWDPGLKNAAD
jgi:PTH1 family peptidyl-tRNA hydrolase